MKMKLVLMSIVLQAGATVLSADNVETTPAAAVDTIVKDWIAAGKETHDEASEREKIAQKIAALGSGAVATVKARVEAISVESPNAAAAPLIAAAGALKIQPLALKLLPHATRSPQYSVQIAALQSIEKLALPEETNELVKSLAAVLNAPKELPDIQAHERMLNAAVQTVSTLAARSQDAARILVLEFSTVRDGSSELARHQMISALKLLETREAEDMLLSFMSDNSATVRRIALEALGDMKSRRAPFLIIPYLNAREPEIQRGAVMALGRMKHMPSLEQLIPLLDSADEAMKVEARWAVKNIAGRAFPDTATAKLWLDDAKAKEKAALALQLSQIKTQDPALAPVLVEELGALVLERPRVVDALLPMLGHQNFRVRAAACMVLGRSGDQRAVSALIGRLTDSSPEVSLGAWRALKQLTDKEFSRDPREWYEWAGKRG